jgi:hypothetical protein
VRCIANTHLKKDEIIEANNFSFLAIGGGCIPYLIANFNTVPCARVENLGENLGGFSGWVFWVKNFNTVPCARVENLAVLPI